MKAVSVLALLALLGCKSAPPEAFVPRTPNDFLAAGAPTFVVGTLGDDTIDRQTRGQVDMIQQMLFPQATVITDEAAASNAPTRPIVYGGPHHNAWLAKLAADLPFKLDAKRLVIGDLTLEGADIQMITVVPVSSAHPEMLVYAGTAGVAEINAVRAGNDNILIADAFGPLYTGQWIRNADGTFAAKLSPPSRRITWRDVTRAGATYRFPTELAAAPNEDLLVEAAQAGLQRAMSKLGLTQADPITVYVHPDVRSKQALTGNGGDGHAIPGAHVLHIIARNPVDVLTPLVAHEATHILAYHAFGPVGTPLMGEGLAVWVAGQYAGTELAEWELRLGKHPPIRELIGAGFRKTPERVTYPTAGLLVQTMIALVGLEPVTKHILGATPSTWDAACKQAGTSAELIESAFERTLIRPR